MCSTSRPINQEPKETSSFAYLWSMCLEREKKTINDIFKIYNKNKMQKLSCAYKRGLTYVLKCKLPNLWKLRIFDLLHDENTYFPPLQISNIPVHGTWPPYQKRYRWRMMNINKTREMQNIWLLTYLPGQVQTSCNQYMYEVLIYDGPK